MVKPDAHARLAACIAKVLGKQVARKGFAPQTEYPPTQSQLETLMHAVDKPNSTTFNRPLLLKVSEELDLSRLKQAIETAIAAHPYLNAKVVRDAKGNFRVRRDDDAAPIVEVIDAPSLPEGLVAPFDVLGGRLYRAQLYRTGEGSFLFLDTHHIACDGESLEIVLRDIDAAYAGEAVPKEGYTGFDLALDERERRRTRQYDEDREYYAELLSGAEWDGPPVGDVSGKQPCSGALELESDLDLGAVRAFLDANGLSANAFFNAAFSLVLSAFAGKDEALYATTYNGRIDSRLGRTVALMVKAFPVLYGLREGQDAVSFVEGMGRQLVDSMGHDLYTFAEIAREHGIGSDVLFAYRGESFDFGTIGGQSAESVPLELDKAKTTLQVGVSERDGRVVFDCAWRADRYSEDYMRRFVTCLENVAVQLAAGVGPDEVSLLDETTAAEVDALNKTGRDWPESDVVSMFRDAAARFADNVAVSFGGRTWTYREVDSLSERVACELRDRGVRAGDVVSILLPRCEWMPIAALGALKTGAAYQPMDPDNPAERLAFMMDDADATTLIADGNLLGLVPGWEGPVLLTGDISSLPDRGRVEGGPGPEDAFAVLYTSGSTGTPKGVVLEHRSLSNFCRWYQEYYEVDDSCRVAAYASFAFDASMMDTYPALTAGARTCIAPEEIRLDLPALSEWFEREGITHCFMTTQVGRQFYKAADVESLRWFSIGGESLVSMSPKANGPRFVNLYGPTECTILTTAVVVDRSYERVPIGRPLTNYRCYVVDPLMRRLPPLVPGELLIAGYGVGRGYLNRPELTESAFIANPFSDEPGYERAYRTGDIVRVLPDGVIDFLGRNDSQVKVRGYRVELSEVEGTVREFPGVTDATVQAFEDGTTGEKYLAAYVVSESAVDPSELKAFVAARKPAYMVPAVTVQVDTIPLNQNQKVDRRALPRPERPHVESVVPQNETQQRISDCICEVIAHTEFGIDTDVFEVGLSSIGAIRLSALLSEAFGVPVSIRDLMAYPTIRALEEFLSSSRSSQQSRAPQMTYPLTQMQIGSLLATLANPHSTVFNTPILFRLSENLDLARLKQAIETAIAAHPYLNAKVVRDAKGNFRVRRDDDAAPIVEVIDAPSLPEGLVAPFDVLGGRLYRAQLYRTGEGSFLFLDTHHIACDGESLEIVLRDIDAAYAGEAVPKEGYTGFDLALDERERRRTRQYDEDREYYAELLSGAEWDGPPVGDVSGKQPCSGALELESDLDLGAVRAFLDANGLSANAFFNAAFSLVLSAFAGKDEALYATTYNGRIDSRLGRTVALMVKAFPVLYGLREGQDAVSFVEGMGRQLVDSMGHDLYTFAEVAWEHGSGCDVLFAYQGEILASDTIGGEPADLLLDGSAPDSVIKAPISIELRERRERLTIRCEWCADRYSEDYMRRFVACLETTCAQLAARIGPREIALRDECAASELDA